MMELLANIRFRCNQCKASLSIHCDDIEPNISYIDHGENGMGDETLYNVDKRIVCPKCGNVIMLHVSGSEYPQGAINSTSNSIEGATYIEDPRFVVQYAEHECQESVLSKIVSYCDKEYTASEAIHPCSVEQCTHDCKNQRSDSSCNCISCLEEVHYHHINGRRTYNCSNLVNCYGCRYLNKFVSEFSYALRVRDIIKKFSQFRVISIGCGPAPDLMALELFRYENGLTTSLQYRGFDLNEYWVPIHQQINQYCKAAHRMDAKFFYKDAVDYFSSKKFPEANVLVLQYVISHFHNTNQFDQLHQFFENIVDSIISKMLRPSIVIIHDINHYAFGRDQFTELTDILKSRGIHGSAYPRFFNNNISHPSQRYGESYPSTSLLYPPTDEIRNKYCRGNNNCSGVSLIIELGVQE